MSIEMQTAVTRDQSVAVTLDSPPTFPDNQPKSPDFKEPPQIKDNAQDDDADLGPQPELPVEPSKQSDSKTAEVTAIEELQKVCEEKGITPEQALKFAISRKLAGETTKTILQLTPQAVGKLTKVIGSNARLVEEIKKL
jgi:hypothetical protein